MKKNIYALIIFVTVIITACSNNQSTTTSDSESSAHTYTEDESSSIPTQNNITCEEATTYVEKTYTENNVHIITIKYIFKNDYMDYSVTYPQFEEDAYGLNEQIKVFALETVEELGFEPPYYNEEYNYSEERTIHEDYKLEYFDSNILSISITGYYDIKGTAHPSYSARTINFDMNTGDKINISERATIDVEFVNRLLNNAKEQLSPEVYEYLSNKATDELISYCNNANTMYFTQDGIGIYYEVIYALGGYANINIY